MEQHLNEEGRNPLVSLIRRIEEIESSLIELEGKPQSQYFTRKTLAEELKCSERFLQDNLAFKEIEHWVGGRVFYLRDEVEIVIRYGNKNKKETLDV